MIYTLLATALFLAIYTTATLAELPSGKVETSWAKVAIWALTAMSWAFLAIHQGWVSS